MTEDKTAISHFEGLGNVWDALLDDVGILLGYLQKSLEEAELVFNNQKFACCLDLTSHHTGVFHLIALGKAHHEYLSSSPFLKGINQELTMREAYTWQNRAEGEFTAGTAGGVTLSFYDPCYAVDIDKWKANERKTVSLSAVAYTLEKLKEEAFTVEKGGFFELKLQAFLKAHPDKTQADFAAPVFKVDAGHFRMFCERDYSSEYEVAGQIEAVAYTSFLGEEIAVLKVNFSHQDEVEKLFINVYVSRKILKDYRPKTGDGISAVIWLCGWLNESVS